MSARMTERLLSGICAVVLTPTLQAQVPAWTVDQVFSNVTDGNLALEIQAGPLTDGPDPTFGIVILYNDGAQNQLVGIADTPPYFDGIFTTQTLTSAGQGFSMGDICVGPSGNAMPVVDEFDLSAYQYNDTSSLWLTQTVPDTSTPNFFTSDCISNDNGFYIAGYNGQSNAVQVFRSTDGGTSFSDFSTIADPGGIVTPHPSESFCGLRDNWSFDPQTQNLIITYQVQNGDVFYNTVDSLVGTAGIPQLITGLPSAPGCTPFVLQEGDTYTAVIDGETLVGGIFSDGAGFHGFLDPLGQAPTTVPLSPHGDGGAFGFIGVTFDTWDQPDNVNPNTRQAAASLFDESGYFYIPGTGTITEDLDFPGAGLGGPIESCTREQLYREIEEAFFGPDNPMAQYTFYGRLSGGIEIAHRPVGNEIFRAGFSDYQSETNWLCDEPYEWP